MAPRRGQQQKPDKITQAGRIVGLAGIVVFSVLYYVTDRVSPELIGVCALLWGGTEGAAALKALGGKK